MFVKFCKINPILPQKESQDSKKCRNFQIKGKPKTLNSARNPWFKSQSNDTTYNNLCNLLTMIIKWTIVFNKRLEIASVLNHVFNCFCTMATMVFRMAFKLICKGSKQAISVIDAKFYTCDMHNTLYYKYYYKKQWPRLF